MTTVHISEETLIKAMLSDETRAALKTRADQIAANMNARIAANKMSRKLAVSRESGNRPKHNRPYEEIMVTSTDEDKPVPQFVIRRLLDASQ